jgi:hypothetical protein
MDQGFNEESVELILRTLQHVHKEVKRIRLQIDHLQEQLDPSEKHMVLPKQETRRRAKSTSAQLHSLATPFLPSAGTERARMQNVPINTAPYNLPRNSFSYLTDKRGIL